MMAVVEGSHDEKHSLTEYLKIADRYVHGFHREHLELVNEIKGSEKFPETI